MNQAFSKLWTFVCQSLCSASPLDPSHSSGIFSAEESSMIAPCVHSERPSQEWAQPGEAAVPRHLAPSLSADPGMWHNSMNESLCHQQCRDISAGPGFPVNIINNPWLVLAQNDDKWAVSVSPGKGNHIWSAVVVSVFAMCRTISLELEAGSWVAWASFHRAVGCGTETGLLPHPVCHTLFGAFAACNPSVRGRRPCFVSSPRGSTIVLSSLEQIPGCAPAWGAEWKQDLSFGRVSPDGVWRNPQSLAGGGAWASLCTDLALNPALPRLPFWPRACSSTLRSSSVFMCKVVGVGPVRAILMGHCKC